jgi:hypothetical protein
MNSTVDVVVDDGLHRRRPEAGAWPDRFPIGRSLRRRDRFVYVEVHVNCTVDVVVDDGRPNGAGREPADRFRSVDRSDDAIGLV